MMQPQRESHNPAHPLEGTRVLLVEDHGDTREGLTLLLESRGARVRAVSSVSEALFAFEQETPHAVVADLGMPDQDGYALVSLIRGMPAERGGRAFVVALTGHSGRENRDRSLAAGFDAHLSKPIEIEALASLLAGCRG
jgi:CheY-like chemotaxis protein